MDGTHLFVSISWALVIVLVDCFPWAAASQPCSGLVKDEHCPVAFLQTGAHVRGRSLNAAPSAARPSGLAQPWGRTLFSADPRASAEFFVKYFQAVRVPLPECSLAQRAAVRLSVAYGDEPQTLVFINDPATGAEDLLQQISDAGHKILSRFGKSEQATFVPWIDNHDAYSNNTAVNVSAIIEDQLPMEIYHDPFDGTMVLRLYVPGTLWTVGTGANTVITEEQTQQLEAQWLQPFPELCREDPGRLPDAKPGWTKSTHMSARPEIAAKFMVDILGAEPLEPAFPWPPQEGCTAVQWVIFPDSLLQVHFVMSKEWELDGFSIREEAQKMDALPALQSGSIHAAMHNSLVFTANSLDEYVLRLQAQSLPYEVFKACAENELDESYALIMVIPQNSITVQIRSEHVSIDLITSSRSRCSFDINLNL